MLRFQSDKDPQSGTELPYITNHIQQFRVKNIEELEISNIVFPDTPLNMRNKEYYVEGCRGLS